MECGLFRSPRPSTLAIFRTQLTIANRRFSLTLIGRRNASEPFGAFLFPSSSFSLVYFLTYTIFYLLPPRLFLRPVNPLPRGWHPAIKMLIVYKVVSNYMIRTPPDGKGAGRDVRSGRVIPQKPDRHAHLNVFLRRSSIPLFLWRSGCSSAVSARLNVWTSMLEICCEREKMPVKLIAGRIQLRFERMRQYYCSPIVLQISSNQN